MGAQRAKNGHPEPYHVKFWDIGNEPYGSWQHGHTDMKYYVIKHNEFARAMRAVDPTITLLASGAMPDEMTVEGQPHTMGIQDPQVHFGDPQADWTGGLLAHSFGNFDALTEHWYVRVGKRYDYEHAKTLPMDAPIEAGYVNADETVLEWVRHPANRVHKKAEEWQEYVKRFPAITDKHIFLSVDEYGYGGGSLKADLAYGMILNEMFRHTDFMKMAAYTMATLNPRHHPHARRLQLKGCSLQALPRSLRNPAGCRLRKLAAACAKVSALRRPAGDQFGQPHLSARHGGRTL